MLIGSRLRKATFARESRILSGQNFQGVRDIRWAGDSLREDEAVNLEETKLIRKYFKQAQWERTAVVPDKKQLVNSKKLRVNTIRIQIQLESYQLPNKTV